MSSRPNTAQGSDKPFTRKNLATLAASLGSTNNPVYVSHKAQIAALAWSPSGKKLATASVDGNVRVWGVSIDTVHADKKEIKPENDFVHGSKEVPAYLVFHPRRDDQLLVVGGHTTKVYTLGPKNTVTVHCEADIAEAFAAAWDTHDMILVAQPYNKFSLLDARKSGDKGRKREVQKLDIGSGDEVAGVRFIDKGRRVLLATQHGVEIRSWPNFREKLTVLDGHAKHLGRLGGVTAMATTREEDNKPNKPFTRLLATGGQDTLIHVWDLQQAVPQTTIYRPDEAVHALSFSADQALLAYCQEPLPGQPGSVEVMETTTGRHVTSIPLQRGTEHMAFSPRQSRLLALAESVVIPPAYRDSKSRDTTAGNVALVLLK